MDENNVRELRHFISLCRSNPSLLNDPSLVFFKSYLQSLGASIPTDTEKDTEEHDDEIVESDIELDSTDVVEADNDDPPEMMGDPSIEVTEEKQEVAQVAKSKAMESVSAGNLDDALRHITQAIMSNPRSAIFYATRASIFVKLKKPNAAIRDANAALEINPDSGKGYKVRGMARAMLGDWEKAAADLHVASKIDYDEEIETMLHKVEPNAQKIREHRRKYERLLKARDLKRAERERRAKLESQEREAVAALKEGEVISVKSKSEAEGKLESAGKAGRVAVLYFTAVWCGPCRAVSPLYAGLAKKHPKLVFLKADIDVARDAAAHWGISSVPTFLFIKNGVELDKLVGADKNALHAKLDLYA